MVLVQGKSFEVRSDEILGKVKMAAEIRKNLFKVQAEGNAALKKIPDKIVISNGDMDCKNVLWADGKPHIVDLECLIYCNPYTELYQLALCWSGCEHQAINFGLITTFIKSYIQEYGEIKVDWKTLYYTNDRLWWLEHNVKKALMIDCKSELERDAGIEQVKEAMKYTIYYDSIKEDLLRELRGL